MDAVLPRDDFKAALDEIAKDHRTIYVPFRPEVLGEASSSDPTALARATKNDPWDGRSSREEAFIEHLKAICPQSEVKDLDPTLDFFRGTKDTAKRHHSGRRAKNGHNRGLVSVHRSADQRCGY